MLPLSLSEEGQPLVVKRIGGSQEVKKHLEDLGFHVGSEITVVNSLGQNLIVNVKESRIALSDELARKIMV